MKIFSSKRGKFEGRHTSPRSGKRKYTKSLLALCLVLALGVCLTIGGTIAFLQEKTETVTNTFTVGNITYTLNLMPNADGVEMPTALNPQTSTSLSATFALDKAPAKTGYTFGGWYYEAACTTQHTDIPGTSIEVTYGDEHDGNNHANKVEITLYAKWTANNYQVAYNGNGATSGQMSNSAHTYDVAKNLTANAYVRTGYRFLGWSEEQNATTATYTDAQSVTNLASEDGAVVTLYAVWERMDYTVTFDAQAAGVVVTPVNKTVTYQLTYGELPAPTRAGYIFNGWTLEKNGGTTVTKDSIVNIADNHTLYAQWTPISYTVKYSNNVDPDDKTVSQPTGSTADSQHTYDVEKKLNKNGYSRTGYNFLGWNTKPDGSGAFYADESSVKNLTTENNGVVTLYAQWGVKSYVIRYHANGGEGTMADQLVDYDKMITLSANQFTKDDFTFGGWAITPTGERQYIDKQEVVNLLENGILDLYAVWLQNSHTVTFDYQKGSGTPPTIEVLAGKAYGVLPTYPTFTESLFKGWYTAPTGGTRVYPETIVTRTDDHTLYAHWESSPANDVVYELTVKNNPDDNNDGIADDIYLNFTCTSSFEKFNIPLNNLVPGQTYKLSYTASHNASFGDYKLGYETARYGSYIVDAPTEYAGNINNAIATDIIATWNDRIQPNGLKDGSQAAINDAWLQGPWNRTITFTATKSQMYWTWEFGLMQDNINNDYNIMNIVLEPVAPTIAFANKSELGNGTIVSQTNTAYSTTFKFDGESGCETVYLPIKNLSAGLTYTISFDHEFSGNLIHDTKNYSTPTYEYGFGIMNDVPTKTGDKMTNLGTWASNVFVKKTVDNKVDGVTLTFQATGNTAYLVFNMANCTDNGVVTTKLTVTNLSASNAGKSVTFYTAPSNAGSSFALDLRREEVKEIQFVWDGIDDTYMDNWYPVDEQYPTAGDSYELAFEPSEGYTMSEFITVGIDDMIYQIPTNGQTEEGIVAPVYDPETNILTIPAEMLTADTAEVSVTASAVPVENIGGSEGIEDEAEEPSEEEPKDPDEEPAVETEPSDVGSDDAALPPSNKEEGEGSDGDAGNPNGSDDDANIDGTDDVTETPESSSEEVAQ